MNPHCTVKLWCESTKDAVMNEKESQKGGRDSKTRCFGQSLFFYGLLLYYSIINSFSVAWLHLGISILIAYIIVIFTAFSLGTFLSAINVKYRDVRYVLPFLIQTLFFITPVMYDTSIIKQPWIKTILELNPLNFAIDLIRNNIINSSTFLWTEWSFWVPVVIILLYIIAIYTFRKTEAYFADIV